MIQGFDEQTAPLTDEEKRAIPLMVSCLKTKVGKAMTVTNKKITSGMVMYGYKLTEPRVRKIINHIRLNDLVPCLIATSNGYYVADTEEEVKNYEESLKGRISAQQEVLKAIHRQGMQKFALL